MTDLSTRVAALDHEDRETFTEAYGACNGGRLFDDAGRPGFRESYARWCRFRDCIIARAWLDAAALLVPEGCGWLAGWGQTRPDEPMGGARITRNARFVGYDANYDAIADAEAATPALALLSAALKARGL